MEQVIKVFPGEFKFNYNNQLIVPDLKLDMKRSNSLLLGKHIHIELLLNSFFKKWKWNSPDWKTYLAKDCIKVAGQVGGDISSGSLFNRKLNSNPNPDIPSGLDMSWTLPSPCKSDNPKLKQQKAYTCGSQIFTSPTHLI